MQYYAPDGMAAGNAPLFGQDWATALDISTVPMLFGAMAASRQAAPATSSAASGATPPSHIAFQPEATAGYCASC